MNTLTFLQLLYPTLPNGSFISLWEQKTKLSRHVRTHEEAVTVCTTWTHRDVYFGVGLRGADLGPSKRGGKRDVSYIPGLWIDLDIGDKAHRAGNCPSSLEEGLNLLGVVPFPPTLIVHSGYGMHVYYLFDRLEQVNSLESLRAFEEVLKSLQGLVITAGAQKGYHIDDTAEASRVLRVVGSFNYKLGEDSPVPVTVLDAEGPRHSLLEMRNLLGCGRVTPPTQPIVPTATAQPATPTAPPAVYLPMPQLISRLRALSDLKKRAMWSDILEGKSFASADRDAAMLRAVGVLSMLAPANPIDELAELFRASLAVWAAEPYATKTLEEEMFKVKEKLTRSRLSAGDKRQDQSTDDLAIISQFESLPGPKRAPIAPYRHGELTKFAEVAHCSLEDLPRRWILQKDDSYYILSDVGNGEPRYSSALRRIALRTAIPQYLSRAPLQWTRAGNKGKTVPCTTEELLDAHCTVAEHLSASLLLQSSYFDAETRTYHEAVCPLRKITPIEHPDVHMWLEALGGTDASKLLDWVATVTALDHRTCALYLSGPPGTGKSLLATGLARLWTEGSPTALSRILDNFNADLTRCPLILADEALPSDHRGKQTSATLREILGNETRTLSRKFQPNSDLRGNIRLILAANNEAMLAFNEDMTPEDIDALSQRVMHIDTSSSAGWLAARGPNFVEGWVTSDIIAQHALYLRDTRVVPLQGRWLVQGSVGKVHHNIATRGTIQGMVAEWLVRHLDQPSSSIPSTAPVQIGGGNYLINATVLVWYWEQYIRHERPPSTGRIGRVLKGISKSCEDDIRINGVRCHNINIEILYQWAQDHMLGDLESMKIRVASPLPATSSVSLVQPSHAATVHDIKMAINQGAIK